MKTANASLWSLQAGEICRIQDFAGELAVSYRERLMEFGFFPGEVVSCLQSPALGAPKVYRVGNSVFSLDDEIATRIVVTPLQHD